MVIKNTEREELHKTIWNIAEDLRGSVDGWDFKAYILGAIFYRYISENLTQYINQLQSDAGITDFDYATMSDEEAETAREMMVQEKGFFILPSQLFQNVAKKPEKNANLNETLNSVFRSIEASAAGSASEEQVKGLFSDFIIDSSRIGNSVEMRNKCIAAVLTAVRDMQLSKKFADNSIDTVGDTYEFLMQMYASKAGKSGGEFFTPQEVSEVLARIASYNNPHVRKVYDPACGSGSLLMKFVKYAGDKAKEIEFYGQEINPTTYNLCRINMFLHDVNYAKFDIQLGNTLTTPLHLGQHFDAIVSNPPYSTKWEGKDSSILVNDARFSPAGVLAPKAKSDLAFTMHMLYHLNETGTCAIVEFPGVLYRGGAEKKIREYLIRNNFVDTVIQLPANLFFGVPIATCIIAIKKNKLDSKVLFVDASSLCYKDGDKNKLAPEDQDAIVNAYTERKEKQYFTKLVDNDEILANDSNLSVSSYVEQEDKREVIDIVALNKEIEALSKEMIDSAQVESIGQEGMSKVEQLVKKLCPKGVDRVRLDSILDYEQPTRYIVSSTEYDKKYKIPVLTAGKCFILGYTNEENGIYEASPKKPTIVFDDFTTGFHWVDFDFKVKSSAIKMLKLKKTKSKNDLRYVYMAMKAINFIPRDHVRHWISIYGKFDIPLPHPDVQHEIVSILDTFETHISKLEQLIALHEKQYAYYREKLLTFD